MQLRACFFEKSDIVPEDFDSDGYAHRLSGFLSEVPKEILGYHMLQRHNISLMYYPVREVLGHEPCIEAVSADRVDATPYTQPFPVLEDNARQGPVFWQHESVFTTAYKKNEFHEAPQLMEFVSGISKSFVLLLMTSLFTIALTAWLSFKIHGSVCRRKRCRIRWKRKFFRKIIWSFVNHLLGVFSFTPLERVKILLLMLNLAIASYKCYIGAVTNTEQVVRTKPLMLDSLDKLIEHRVPFAFAFPAEVAYFKLSQDAQVKQLMKLSESPGHEIMIENWLKPSAGEKMVRRILQMEQVVVSTKWISHSKLVCSLSLLTGIDEVTDYKLLVTEVDHVAHPLYGMVFKERYMRNNSAIARVIHKAVRVAALESQLGITYVDLSGQRLTNKEMFGNSLDLCMTNMGTTPLDPKLFSPSFSSMRSLLTDCQIILLVSVLVLCIEKIGRILVSKL